MPDPVLAVLLALFIWWFSTGLILIMVRSPRWTHVWSMAAVTALTVLCLWGLYATRRNTTTAGAFAGFTYGVVVWAWIEMSFLAGYITGPRRTPLDGGSRGWPRFLSAFQTVSTHELVILAAGAVMIALTFGAPNQVGAWTFLVLWIMRISAKLNIFFGAPKISDEFLPTHLGYLSSYFERRRVSLFFPISVSLASAAFAVLVYDAATTTDPFHRIAVTLAAAMLGLAIIEHWFLVLPLPDAALWRWALRAVDVGRVSESVVRPPNPAGAPAALSAALTSPPPVREKAEPAFTSASGRQT